MRTGNGDGEFATATGAGEPTPWMTDLDLTARQRAWRPVDVIEAYRQWPAAARVELGGKGMVFQAGDVPEAEAWDWRSVALAVRAYPTSRITLRSPWVLEVSDLTWDDASERYPLIDVVDVRVVSRYIVELTFESGERRVIDLEGDLWGPIFEPMRIDYAYFCSVTVDRTIGTIVWPNGADMAPEVLYADSRPVVPGDDGRTG